MGLGLCLFLGIIGYIIPHVYASAVTVLPKLYDHTAENYRTKRARSDITKITQLWKKMGFITENIAAFLLSKAPDPEELASSAMQGNLHDTR